jgi:hypothetical protein
MARMSAILRNRGAVTGVLLILLGVWGGLVPFVGPYFHYAYTPDVAWHITLARLWLEILPAAAAVASGGLVLASTGRLLAGGGAILAALAGGWFVAGTAVNAIWAHLGTPGVPAGTSAARAALEELGLFTGLGAVVIFCAALMLGRASATAHHPRPGPEAETATSSVPADWS